MDPEALPIAIELLQGMHYIKVLALNLNIHFLAAPYTPVHNMFLNSTRHLSPVLFRGSVQWFDR